MSHPSTDLTARPPTGAGAVTSLVAGVSLSYFGLVLTRFALPVIAAATTRDPALVSAVAVAQSVPWLLLGLIAGTVVDGSDRRLVQLTINALRLAALLTLLAAIARDVVTPVLLVAIAAMDGLTDTFLDTARAALVPAVVGADRLDQANSRLYAARTPAENLAAPVAGALATRSLALAVSAGVAAILLALVAW